jgi:hypothetical protein
MPAPCLHSLGGWQGISLHLASRCHRGVLDMDHTW